MSDLILSGVSRNIVAAIRGSFSRRTASQHDSSLCKGAEYPCRFYWTDIGKKAECRFVLPFTSDDILLSWDSVWDNRPPSYLFGGFCILSRSPPPSFQSNFRYHPKFNVNLHGWLWCEKEVHISQVISFAKKFPRQSCVNSDVSFSRSLYTPRSTLVLLSVLRYTWAYISFHWIFTGIMVVSYDGESLPGRSLQLGPRSTHWFCSYAFFYHITEFFMKILWNTRDKRDRMITTR